MQSRRAFEGARFWDSSRGCKKMLTRWFDIENDFDYDCVKFKQIKELGGVVSV